MEIAKSAELSRSLATEYSPDDIRGPLNLTRMLLELLTESPINSIQKAHLENALHNLSDIEVIVDQGCDL